MDKMQQAYSVGIHVWPYVEDIKVAKIADDAVLPTRKHPFDAGIDFYAVQDTLIPPHSVKVVRTGITMELPPHYFGLLKPKGGSNFDILAGVVDSNYQGEILFKVHNPFDDNISFMKGQAVGQMVIIPIIRPALLEVNSREIHAEESDRGPTGGIVEDVE